MSKQLVTLLGVDEKKFKAYIERLEHVTLRPGIDIRLGAEILTKTRSKITELQLDIHDTTPKELFFALKHKLAEDEAQLIQKLSLLPGDDEHIVTRIAAACNKLSGREKSLSLTSAGIKRLLKAVPPKRTMKALKYRSLDSVLKRHDPRILYTLACHIENDSWKSQVYAKIRRLDSKDTQWQHVTCMAVPEKWFEKVQDFVDDNGAIVVNEESGSVCLLPVVDVNRRGSTVLIIGMALQAMTTVATKSLPYKKQALSQGFANVIPKIALDDHPTLSSIHGLTPTWKVVHELIGNKHISVEDTDADFELFDLHWEQTETKFASLVVDMDFWVGTHYLAVGSTPTVVSMHVLDIALALASEVAYGRQMNVHLEGSLWNELQIRYLTEEIMARSLVNQLSKASGDVLL